jgi:general secretion pathway protein K
VRASLEDAQGRININGLAAKARGRSAASGEAGRFTPQQRRFIRLVQALDEPALSQPEAIALAEAVIDWLDSDDDVTGFGGAEADYYLHLQDAYRPGNGPMADISELRLLRYMTPQLYQQLQAYLVALPETALLNINSAPLAVVRSINRQSELLPMDRYTAQRVVSWRDEGRPFTSIERFVLHEELLALSAGSDGVIAAGLSVRSDYFLLRAQSQVMGRYRAMQSLIQRDAAGGQVLRRRSL